MSLQTISQKNIIFTDKNDIKYDSYEKGNINIVLDLPILKVPFGLEENYGKFEIKFELDDKCKYVKNIIKKVEEELSEQRDVSESELRSNIREKEGYKDLLIVRVPFYRNRFISKIKSNNDNLYLPTFYDLYKNMKASATIQLKKCWIYENKYGITVELKSLTIF